MAISINDKIIAEQRRQAELAARMEGDRQQRLDYGSKLIEALFSGGRVADPTGTAGSRYNPNQTYYKADGSEWTPEGVTRKLIKAATPGSPAVYETVEKRPTSNMNVQRINTPTQTATVWDPGYSLRADGSRVKHSGATTAFLDTLKDKLNMPAAKSDMMPEYEQRLVRAATKGTPAEYYTSKDAAGQFEDMRSGLSRRAPVEYGGFGDDFFDQYGKAVLDYQLPQLDEQFDRTNSKDFFQMARQGLARSSAATDVAARRVKERDLNEGAIRSGAEEAKMGLRGQVQSAKQRAMQSLFATEDPTAGVNAALTEANAVQNVKPDVSPLGQLFEAAGVGINAFKNVRQADRLKDAITARKPSGSTGKLYG